MSSKQIFATGDSGEANDDLLFESGQKQVNTPQIDALLDQIDNVLATDAQSFVSGFVQKGGQ